jgi:hypothetical protein
LIFLVEGALIGWSVVLLVKTTLDVIRGTPSIDEVAVDKPVRIRKFNWNMNTGVPWTTSNNSEARS